MAPSQNVSLRGNLMSRKKWHGCVSLDEYRMEQKVGEGTFGVVHKAVHRKTGKVVALKKILLRPEQEGVFNLLIILNNGLVSYNGPERD